ncbi:ankyrin repeat domain-containing protein [Occallatibacter riparius]|uniref:Ankyrin repeat domain-containing protein n=1 Tax=Occallatibacter riparius TaxID=1002689 RepID=A0A9J7BJ89_9BACT|nr:ankyrin repeat domain-containing protein [Occallatibacter riparius]UWZ81858.1 ankyrin repeat domain-containing protein [Occallatibacter riparius]
MPEKQLPVRPNLEQYKKQAKELARACRNNDAEALARVRAHHPQTPEGRVALADAQLVLAREHGFESWPKFAAEVERLRIAADIADLADPVDAFLRAALVPRDGTSHSGGTLDEANAIVARYPQVAGANIFTAAALGDEAAVREFVARDGSLATQKGGPYGWDALCHLCFSRYLRLDAARSDAFVSTARALLDAGADPNAGWYEKPWRAGDPEVWESALYGAAGAAHHPGVTQLLLDRGADPNDGETPYHVPEGYDNTVLEILLKSGKVDERGKAWILCRKADWHDYEGMQLALEYKCDPNFIPHWGTSALQHSVQRDNRIEIIRLLLDNGGDPLLPNKHDGGNAVQMAARRGRGDVLKLLAERGVDTQLRGFDGIAAASALADRERAEELLKTDPGARAMFEVHKGDLLGAFAGVGNTEGVRCLLDVGVQADALYFGDAYFGTPRNSTALHVAAWHGNSDTMRLLIARGAPLEARDGDGLTALQLAIRACTSSYWQRRRTPEWVEPLLKAGASTVGIEVPTGYAEADELIRKYGPTE